MRAYARREELYNKTTYNRPADVLAVFKDDDLLAAPGQRFVNTPYGYLLLGLLIERVSGLSLEDSLRHHVFGPAGMSTADLEEASAIVPYRAGGYRRLKSGALIRAIHVDMSDRRASDGIIGTVVDLGRFAEAWLNHKLIGPELTQVMSTGYHTAAGQETHYGLGCFVREETGRRIVGHSGWQPGAAAFLVIAPDQRAAVAVLANLGQADVKSIGLALLDILVDGATRPETE